MYALREAEEVSYRDPPPVQFETDSFAGELRDGRLEIQLKTHCRTADEARELVRPFLRGWEIHSGLQDGREPISFDYQTAKVIDRDPPADGRIVIHAETGECVLIGESVTLHVTRVRYPPAPEAFVATPDVETLWNRYGAANEGREPLQGMAYFNLTVAEGIAGGRREAGELFNFDYVVLRKIGELSSERGDAATARKMPPDRDTTPLSGPEKTWLQSAIRRLIAQIGEVQGGGTPTRVTMSDLPPL